MRPTTEARQQANSRRRPLTFSFKSDRSAAAHSMAARNLVFDSGISLPSLPRPAAKNRPQRRALGLTSAVVRGTTFALCAAVLALPLAACGGKSATAAPGPTTVQQVCDAQAWPRPVPQVVGVILNDADSGALACWDNVKAIAPDGHDLENGPESGTYRITGVSPAPGTPIGRSDVVTLQVVPVDVTASPAFHPCGWVTADQAAKFLGVSSTSAVPAGDESGSAEPFCSYRSDSHFVTSQLSLPASFAVDAQTELNMLVAGGRGNEVAGLPGRAYCSTTQSGGKTSTTLQVLLGGNRLYQALGWDGESCDTLKQFAQTAIPRIS
jgi:hypothetical protein